MAIVVVFTVVACAAGALVVYTWFRSKQADVTPLTAAQLSMIAAFWCMGAFAYLEWQVVYPLAVAVFVASTASIVHVLKRKLLYPAFSAYPAEAAAMAQVDRALLVVFVLCLLTIAAYTVAAAVQENWPGYNAGELAQIICSALFTVVSVLELRWFAHKVAKLAAKRPVTGSTTNYAVEKAFERIYGIRRLTIPIMGILVVNLVFCAASIWLGTILYADLLVLCCLALCQPVFAWWHKLMFLPSAPRPVDDASSTSRQLAHSAAPHTSATKQ